MIAVALKGLAGRKVRALLTALAVVIGVSMVSGTFILTDTMQKSFNGLFTATSAKTDAVISGKEIVKNSTSGSGVTIPASMLDKVRALPEVEAAARRRSARRGQRRRHHRHGRQGGRQGERRRQLRRRQRALQPVQAQDRQAAARARRGRDRRRHRHEEALQGRRHGRRLDARQEAHLPHQRHASRSAASTRSASPASPPGTSRPRRRCCNREGRYDAISVAAKKGTSSAQLVQRDQAARCPPTCRSRTARQQAKDDAEGAQRRHGDDPHTSCSASAASRCSSARS